MTATDTLTAYDAWAASYDQIDNPLVAQSAVLLADRAEFFRGARVLELGCGTGRNAVTALAAGATKYVGIDGSSGMLALARRRLDDPRVSWLEADLIAGARQAMDTHGLFDRVLICLVLEHIESVTPVLIAAAEALGPAGRLLVHELHPKLHDAGVGANFRVAGEEVRLASYRHDGDELRTACKKAGFSEVMAADREPDARALARSAKLARYAGSPVLLEVMAG